MVEATVAQFPAAHGRLLRDLADPSRFESFEPRTYGVSAEVSAAG